MIAAFRLWTTAIRPKTLAASISPILIGITMALSDGYFHGTLCWMTLLTGLGIQISTNFANDYFDFLKGADTAERKGPIRPLQAGLLSLKTMKAACFLSFLFTTLCGCYLVWHGGIAIAFLLAISLLLGVIYTGGPFPLAYLGLGDLFVFVFFGPIAVASSYYLQTHYFSSTLWIAGVGPGAISTAILVVNNLRDIEEDRLSQKKTLLVRFGKTFGKIEYIALMTLAFFTPFFFVKDHPLSLLACLFLIPAFPLIRAIASRHVQTYNLILAKTGQVLFLYSFLFCIGWMV